MMSMNLSDITVLNICGVDYRCTISKSEAMCLLKNANLYEKKEAS